MKYLFLILSLFLMSATIYDVGFRYKFVVTSYFTKQNITNYILTNRNPNDSNYYVNIEREIFAIVDKDVYNFWTEKDGMIIVSKNGVNITTFHLNTARMLRLNEIPKSDMVKD